MTCASCGQPVGPGARFCSHCGQAVTYATGGYAEGTDRLIRPREGRMIAGVCAGFAIRYGWDVVIVRLVLVLAVLFGVGTPVLAYLVAWIVIPNGQWMLPAQVGGVPPMARPPV